jgi:DNA-binding CsgD family transcriptional regulator
LRKLEVDSAENREQIPLSACAPTQGCGGVEQFLAQVVAAQPKPQPFNGFVELSDVLLDIEIEGIRCIVLKKQPRRPATPALTARELEIARMVARGLPNKTIASVLQISSWTVSSHLRRMFAKLGVATRAEMIGRLLEQGKFCPADRRPSINTAADAVDIRSHFAEIDVDECP